MDGKQFHRVNRQFILSVDSILDIQPYFNGKAIIKVRPSYDGVIQISREKVPALKLWLDEPYIIARSKMNARFIQNKRTFCVRRTHERCKTSVRFQDYEC